MSFHSSSEVIVTIMAANITTTKKKKRPARRKKTTASKPKVKVEIKSTAKIAIPKSTAEIEVPKRTIDQVIGQDKGVNIIKKAALQKRHVLLIGEPGTGKSMLGQGMAELLPKEALEDLLVFPNDDDENTPVIRAFKATQGKLVAAVARAQQKESDKVKKTIFFILFIAISAITLYYFFIQKQPLILFGGITASVFLLIGMNYIKSNKNTIKVPKIILSHLPREGAPFVDATGAHAGALLGDVRHDPFQSGGLETPPHNRVEAGAIHRAHKGVLFIDEIATLSRKSQIELLTALQEKKCSITGRSERSSGSMVKTEPVPCDFVLIAAGNVEGAAEMNPALRSRIRGYGYEVFMNVTMPDTPKNCENLARFIAQEVKKDGKIPPFDKSGIDEIIFEAKRRAGRKGHLTLKLRDLGGLVRAAGDIAKETDSKVVTRAHVISGKRLARHLEQQIADKFIEEKKEYSVILNKGSLIGRVNGLAVVGGMDSGIVLPIEAQVTPGGEKYEISATGRLGKIAKEAVTNANAVIRKKYGKSLRKNYDIFVQFLQTYEGVEGDSASVAVAAAVISSFKKKGLRQDTAMTGSLSVRGDVLPVGGINAKIEAALEAGIKRVIIPKSNLKDVMLSFENKKKITIIGCATIEDVLKHALVNNSGKGRK